jgi:hypothetical protein
MIGPILLAAAAAAATPMPAPTAMQAQASVLVPKIEIRFDYSNADATLAALSASDKASLDALMALPSTAAVVEKLHRRQPDVSPILFEETLEQARSGMKLQADPYGWQFVLSEQNKIRSLVSALHQMEPAIRDRIAKALAPNIPPGVAVSATVHFIIGGTSSGWEEGANSFYIGLPFYKGDVEGVILTMQHELFHNVEYVGFHEQESDLARLGPREREVYRLLDEMYREGAAIYAEKLNSFSPTTPFIAEMRAPAMANDERMADNFILFDTLSYRLEHDPTSHFADVRSLGFDWDWQNPMYFLGAYMAKYLASQGKSLRDYVRKRPTAFARDYVELCRRDHCRLPVSDAEGDEIVRIDETLSAAGPHGPSRK